MSQNPLLIQMANLVQLVLTGHKRINDNSLDETLNEE
jgi:hypothetical protein